MAQTEQDDNNGEGKEVAVETGFGKFRARGYHLGNVLQIVAAVILGLMAMMMYEMRAETKATAALIITAPKDFSSFAGQNKLEHDKLAVALERSADEQAIMNYILTLAPADREKLNLQMPETLRRRMILR